MAGIPARRDVAEPQNWRRNAVEGLGPVLEGQLIRLVARWRRQGQGRTKRDLLSFLTRVTVVLSDQELN